MITKFLKKTTNLVSNQINTYSNNKEHDFKKTKNIDLDYSNYNSSLEYSKALHLIYEEEHNIMNKKYTIEIDLLSNKIKELNLEIQKLKKLNNENLIKDNKTFKDENLNNNISTNQELIINTNNYDINSYVTSIEEYFNKSKEMINDKLNYLNENSEKIKSLSSVYTITIPNTNFSIISNKIFENNKDIKIYSEKDLVEKINKIENINKIEINKSFKNMLSFYLNNDLFKTNLSELDNYKFNFIDDLYNKNDNKSYYKLNENYFNKVYELLILSKANFIHEFYSTLFFDDVKTKNDNLNVNNNLVNLITSIFNNNYFNDNNLDEVNEIKELISIIKEFYCPNNFNLDKIISIKEQIAGKSKVFSNSIIFRLIKVILIISKNLINSSSILATENNKVIKKLNQISNELGNSNKDLIRKDNLIKKLRERLNEEIENNNKIINSISSSKCVSNQDNYNNLDLQIIEDTKNINKKNEVDYNDSSKNNNNNNINNKSVNNINLDYDLNIDDINNEYYNTNIKHDNLNNISNNENSKNKNNIKSTENNKNNSIIENKELDKLKSTNLYLEEYISTLVNEKQLLKNVFETELESYCKRIKDLESQLCDIHQLKNLESDYLNKIENLQNEFKKLEDKLKETNLKLNNCEYQRKKEVAKLQNDLKENQNMIDRRMISKHIVNLFDKNIDNSIKINTKECLSELLNLNEIQQIKIGLKCDNTQKLNTDSSSKIQRIGEMLYQSLLD